MNITTSGTASKAEYINNNNNNLNEDVDNEEEIDKLRLNEP